VSADLFVDIPQVAAQLDAALLDALTTRWRAEYGQKRPTCQSCRASIRWALTWPKGEWIPIDRDPTPTGNVACTRTGGIVVARVIPADRERAGTRWVSHFTTCPNADEHRRLR